MSKRRGNDKLDAFSNDFSAEEVAAGIYGDSNKELDTGRVVAKPISINWISPDRRQPRRAIPTIVSGYWNGEPEQAASVLIKYQEFAEKESHKKIDVAKAIMGRFALTVEECDGPLYSGFAKLVALAAAIHNEGLTNPITVVKTSATQYQIETGERRWLAHQLLALHIDPKKYGKIAGREVEYDPFRQASENNSREGYNAIEMARQIAILIMAARSNSDGMKYDRFEDMVLAGECDRKFYAQVANGYIHKIPDGQGDKIVNATGLSIARISQYRSLLRVSDDEAFNDELWIEADTKGWTEHYIRQTHLPSLKPKDERLTAVNLSDENSESSTPVEAADLSARIGKPALRALPGGGLEAGVVASLSNRDGYVNFLNRTGDMIEVHHSWLRPTDGTMPDNSPSQPSNASSFNSPQRDGFGRSFNPPAPSPFSAAQTPPASNRFEPKKDSVNYAEFAKSFIGKHVRMSAGNTGKVTGSEGAYVLMVNDGSDLAMSFRVTEIIEVLPDPAQYDVTTMNLKGKRVRLRNNIEGVVQDVFGEKIMLLKDGADRPTEAYKSAIASVITGIDEPQKMRGPQGFDVSDRVLASHGGRQFSGTIRYIKGGQYGVFGDESQSTHYYDLRDLSPLVEPAALNNPPSTKQSNAGGPLITEDKTLTLVQQIYLLAKLLEEGDAEGSLKLLLDANYSNLQSLRAGLAREDVINVIEQHYNNILVLSNRIMAEVEVVLKDIAAFDAAERNEG